jgi:hypothetical protein
MNKNKLHVGLKIKSLSETGEFEGYGSVFGVKDSYSDIVVKGAFARSLANWKEKGGLPAMLWQHKTDEPIGIYTEMSEDENGLVLKGRLLIDDDPLAKRAYAHLKAGSIKGLSIGYSLNDYDYDPEKDAFILKDIDLWEVSLVTFPANEAAQIVDVKDALKNCVIGQPALAERCLRDAGYSRSQSKAIMANGFKALRDADNNIEQALAALKSIVI